MVTNTFQRWYQQADRFDWLSGYLQRRGMINLTRFSLVSNTFSLATILTVLTVSPVGPEALVSRAAMGTAILICCCLAGLWTFRWPTRRQSLGFVLLVEAAISLASVAQPNPLIGLLVCSAFSVIGCYIAVFHASRFLAYNFGLALIFCTLQAAMLARGDLALAVSVFLLILMLNAAAPSGIQIIVYALGIDLLRADRDPLTGLLMRRAFFEQVHDRVGSQPLDGTYLTFVMIDLDKFKQLNDTLGHAKGDETLAGVGRAVQGLAGREAIAGRVGGEELLVVDYVSSSAVGEWGQHICDVIARLPFGVTASVGVASAGPWRNNPDSCDHIIASLVANADAAMYVAKRAGGNRVSCHPALAV